MTQRASGASRFYKTAIVGTTLPLITLGTAAGASATAVPDTDRNTVKFSSAPRLASLENIAHAQDALAQHLGLAVEASVEPIPVELTSSKTKSAKEYTVKRGDTLSGIAAKHKVSLRQLLKWNDGLSLTDLIFPGDKIKVSAGSSSSGSSASKAKSTSKSSSSGSQSKSSAKTYTVKRGDTLSHIAARHGISLSTLLRANGISASTIIYPGQTLKLSGNAASTSNSSAKSSTKSTPKSSAKTYTVKRGDTLSHIASRHGVSLATLLRANGISASTIIYPGQTLKLSGNATSTSNSSAKSSTKSTPKSSAKASSKSSAKTYTVKRGDTLSGIAARNGISLNTLLKANGISASEIIFPGQTLKLSGNATSTSNSSAKSSTKSTPKSSAKASSKSSAKTYTVKRGDTLSGIASRHGISLGTLLNANGLSATSIIYPGQTLKLSGTASSSSSNSGGGVSTATSSSSSSSSSNSQQLVGNTFLHYTYPDHVVANANANKRALLDAPTPSRAEAQELVRQTAIQMGVDPKLALGHAMTESHFDATAVSPANAIGIMQVIPSSGEWASGLVGRELNLLDPQDNVTAGVAIIRYLQNTSESMDIGIASYYQGQAGVRKYGMYPDTKDYVQKVKNNMARF